MFPKDIINIITKYQSENEEIAIINSAIDEIIYQLNKLNGNMIERLKLLLNNINTSEDEERLLHDSQMLRSFISTLNMIEYNKSELSQAQNDLECSGELLSVLL